MDTERLKRIAYVIFIVLAVPLVCFLLIKYVLPVSIPFLIAWAIALASRRPAEWISHRTGISARVCRPVLSCLFILALLSVGGVLIFFITKEVWGIIVSFGEGEEFRAFIDGIFVSGGLIDDLTGRLGEGLSDALFGLATSVLSWLFDILTSFASALPGALLAVVITVISSIYFSLDLDKINSTVTSFVPEGMRRSAGRIKEGFISTGVKYVLSYFLLFLITFATVLVGFLILRVKYALFLALTVALLDLLPVIGVGTFLIPYGIFEIARGNTSLGVGLLILFAVQTLIRELSEPRILGKNLGVHPLLTLVILYIGYSVFGFLGILAVPVFTVIAELFLVKKNSSDVGGDTARE